MKKSFVFFRTFFMSFLASGLASGLAYADPAVVSASYDAFTNTLSITFDEDMDGAAPPPPAVSLSVDNGTLESIMAAPIGSSLQADNRTYDVLLDGMDANTLENWATVATALELELNTGMFSSDDPDYLPNLPVVYADDMAVSYIPAEPQVISATYDAFTDTLNLTFNRDMDPACCGSFAELSVDDGSLEAISAAPISQALLADSRTFALQLSPADASTVEGWATVASALETQICFGCYSSASPDFWPSLEQLYSADVSVTYIPENPQVTNASYDAFTDTLTLTFNRDMDPLPSYAPVRLSVDNGALEFIDVPPLSVVMLNDNRSYAITLNAPDASTVEGWLTVATNLEVEVQVGEYCDAQALFCNNDQLYSDNVSVVYVPEAPQVVAASYDAYTDTLRITFNRDMDPAAPGFYDLSTDNGVGELVNGAPLSAQLAGDNRTWEIVLNPGDANTLEFWTTVATNLELALPPGVYLSADPDYLPNDEITYSGNVSVEFIPFYPKAVSASYDAGNDTFYLTFNRDMDPTCCGPWYDLSVDDGNFDSVGNAPLSRTLLADGRTFAMVLQPGDAASLESWATVTTNLEAWVQQWTYQSAAPDFFGNEDEQDYFSNLQVTYIPDEPQVTNASYDAFTDTLTLTFNRDMDPLPSYAPVRLSVDNGALEFIEVPPQSVIMLNDNRSYAITLSGFDASTVEGWLTVATNLEVEVQVGEYCDAQALFCNNDQFYSDNVSVAYVPEAPQVVAASYDAYTDTLRITFNRDMDPAAPGFYDLSTDNGVGELVNGAPLSAQLAGDNRTWEIVLNPGDANTLEFWTTVATNLELALPPGVYLSADPDYIPNNEITYNDNVSVEYIPFYPKAVSASYDAGNDTFYLTFNRDMDPTCCGPYYELSVDDGNFESVSGAPLSRTLLADGRTFAIELPPGDASTVEGWFTVGTALETWVYQYSYGSAAPDFYSNEEEQDYFSNLKVTYIPDEPQVTNASYDAFTDTLTLTFNRDMDPLPSYAPVRLSVDNGALEFIEVPPQSVIMLNDNRSYAITLSGFDASTVEGWLTVATNLEVEVQVGEYCDAQALFCNNDQFYSDNVSVAYVPEAPQVVAASYDAYTDTLSMTFNRDMDPGFGGFYDLSVDNCNSECTSGPVLSAQLAGDNRTWEIVLDSGDASYVEGWSTVATNLELALPAFTYQSADPDYIPNNEITYNDNVSVEYIPFYPKAVSAAYDAGNDTFYLTFNRDMDPTCCGPYYELSVDDGNFESVSGAPLSRTLLADGRTFAIELPPGDASTVEGWFTVGTALETWVYQYSYGSAAPDFYSNEEEQDYFSNLKVTYIPDEPQVTNASYDAFTDTLTLTFNRDMDPLPSYAPVRLSVDNGALEFINVPPMNVVMLNDNRSYAITLNAPDASTVEGWLTVATNLEVEVQVGEYCDAQALFCNNDQLYSDNVGVAYVVEAPQVVAASYDAFTDTLSMTFNRDMDPVMGGFYDLSVDNCNSECTSGPELSAQLAGDNRTWEIVLDSGVASYVESWSNVATHLELALPAFTYQSADPDYIPNNEITYNDNVSVEYIPFYPKAVSAAYDAGNDTFYLTFNRDMDPTCCGPYYELSVDDGNFESVSGAPLSRTLLADGRTFAMVLQPGDAALLESWATVTTALEAWVPQWTYQSAAPDFFGNEDEQDYFSNLKVTYIPDEPQVTNASYDAFTDTLTLTFNRDMDPLPSYAPVRLSVDNGALEFIDVPPLSVVMLNDNRSYAITLNGPDASTVEGWLTVATNLEVEVQVGEYCDAQALFCNNDQLYSDNVSVVYVPEAPQVVAASYDAYTDTLSITFNRDMDTLYGQSPGLSVDNGTSEWLNVDPISNALLLDGRTYAMQLMPVDASIIESWATVATNLEVFVPTSFQSAAPAFLPNTEQDYYDNVSVEYIPFYPRAVSASYDAGNDTFYLTFNRDMDPTCCGPWYDLSVDDGNFESVGNAPISRTLLADGRTFAMVLQPGDAALLESWATVTTALEAWVPQWTYQSAAPDFFGNEEEQDYFSNLQVTYIPDEPQVTNASYDAFTDTLTLTFNRDMDPLPGFAPVRLSVDNGALEFIDVPPLSVVMLNDNRSYAITLNGPDASTVEGWLTVATNLEVEVQVGEYCDAQALFCNNDQFYSDNVSVAYVPEAPQVVAASYDAYTDTLSITFNRDMDPASVLLEPLVQLSVDDGNGEFINEPTSSQVLLADNRTVEITLHSWDASTIEGWLTVSAALEVQLQLGAYLSAAPDFLPNQEQLYSANVSVTYIPNEPQVVAATYDAFTDTLNLTFNRDMDPAYLGAPVELSVDDGNVEFVNGPPLSSVLLADNRTVAITLNAPDASTVESWLTVATALETQMQLGFYQSAAPDFLPSQEQLYSANVSVEYIPEEPQVTFVGYFEYLDQLEIEFNRDLDDALFDIFGGVGLSVDNGALEYLPLFTPLSDVDGAVDDSIIKLAMDSGNAATIESWVTYVTNLELEISTPNLVTSLAALPSGMVTFADNVSVEVFLLGGDNDGDGTVNELDAFPRDPTEWADFDGDGIGDNADPDDDGDGYDDGVDAFPYDPTEWADTDLDTVGDNTDNCINDANVGQEDNDLDGAGDACDLDDDNDGMPDDWENTYGLNPLVDDAAGNLDGDAFTNLEEYTNGTDPTVPDLFSVTDDTDGDGDADILWQNTTTGEITIWHQQGFAHVGDNLVGGLGVNFVLSDTADLDADGDADMILFDGDPAAGLAIRWEIENHAKISGAKLAGFPGWQFKGTGDFDADGDGDIVWQSENGLAGSDGTVIVWIMENNAKQSGSSLGRLEFGARVVGIGDFDNDGDADILQTTPSATALVRWDFENGTKVAGASIGGFPGYSVKAVGDFNGDLTNDILWEPDGVGQAIMWMMQNGDKDTGVGVGNLTNYDIETVGDYDGDNDTDVLWKNANGVVIIWEIENAAKISGQTIDTFDADHDIKP